MVIDYFLLIYSDFIFIVEVSNIKKNAFTLTELLAVIVILSVLLIIAVPTLSNVIEKSKKSAFISQIQNAVSSIKHMHTLEKKKIYKFSELGDKIKSPFGGYIDGVVFFIDDKAYVYALDSNGKTLVSNEKNLDYGDIVIPVDSNNISTSNIYEFSEKGGSFEFNQFFGQYIQVKGKKYFVSKDDEIVEVNNIYLPGEMVYLNIAYDTTKLVQGVVLSRNNKNIDILLIESYPPKSDRVFSISNKKIDINRIMLDMDINAGGNVKARVLSSSDINEFARTNGYKGNVTCNKEKRESTFLENDLKELMKSLHISEVLSQKDNFNQAFFVGVDDSICYISGNDMSIGNKEKVYGKLKLVVTLNEDFCQINSEECIWPQK